MTNEEINEKIMRLLGWQKLPSPAAPKWQRPTTERGVECWYGDLPIGFCQDVDACEFEYYVMRPIVGNNDRLVVEARYQHPDKIRYTAYIITARHMKIAVCEEDTYQRAVCMTFIAWHEWIAEQVGKHE